MSNKGDEPESTRLLPPVEVAEARIAFALLRYQARVGLVIAKEER